MLFDAGEDEIGSVHMAEVPERLAQKLLLNRFIILGKFVVFGSNNCNWNHRYIDSFGVGGNLFPVGFAVVLYLPEIFKFVIL